MRAAVMRGQEIVVDEIPDPEPTSGQVVVKTLACGICGSDLHMLKHADQMIQATEESGFPSLMDPKKDIVMGHEFCAEIVDFGPNTIKTLKTGTRVCSMPILVHAAGFEAVGYSNRFPGGYGEYMLLFEPMLLPVPDGLPTEYAALTEPMAVGVHAVAKAEMKKNEAPLVVGCGPVGLAVIAGLRLQGIEPIVAADFSPMRRRLAEHMGAHVVVDPSERTAMEAWTEATGAKGCVIYECVGVPGIIGQIMREAPRNARLVIVGVCMEADQFKPAVGINKELEIRFCLGYTPEEFAATLHSIADGKIDGAPLITDRVGVDGVPDAFETLANPDAQAKILVEPWR